MGPAQVLDSAHSMKRQVLFIPGSGAEGYRADGKLVAQLRKALGAPYTVHYPRMPVTEEHIYAAWKGRLVEEIAAAQEPIVLVAHSLGASMILKLLSEEAPERAIAGLFLIATPYWENGGWQQELALQPGFATRIPRTLPLFLYHGSEDEDVPASQFTQYRKQLPWAVFRALDGRDHQLNNDLSEVAQDIWALDHSNDDFPPGLSQPALRALTGAGYTRLEQLTNVTEQDLLKLHGMGPKGVRLLRDALIAVDKTFAEGKDQP